MIYNSPKDFNAKTGGIQSGSSHPERTALLHKEPSPVPPPYVAKPASGASLGKANAGRRFKARSFFVLLFLGALLALMIPLRPTTSAIEKRDLTKFPSFSIATLKSGQYFSGINLWFSDTFPLRERMTELETAIKNKFGFNNVTIHGDVDSGDAIPDAPLDVKVTPSSPNTSTPSTSADTTKETNKNIKTQTLGAILIAGNEGYEYYNYSNSLAPKFINLVSNIKSTAGGKSNVYTLVVPTSTDIVLDDSVRAGINSSDQKKALDYFNKSFKNVTAVTGIYESLRNHRSEYIYFRTDHHWTALGAYYAYEQFAAAKGITPVPLTNYKTRTFKGFLGSFYSDSLSPALKKTPDDIIAYLPNNNVDFKFRGTNGKTLSWPVINDVNDYAASNKYSTFVAGDQPYEVINNLDLKTGDTCLVIKESFGDAYIPFLIPHYKTIYVIDPRHYESTLSSFAKSHPVTDIVFIANISTTRNSVFINAMSDFIR